MDQKKRFISIFVGFVAIFGVAQFASAGVVQYTSEQDILLTGPNITLKIESGSQADSVAVDATTVTVTTGASDTFVIRSDNRYLLTNSQNVHVACTSSYSKSTFSGAWVVTYTPSTTTCTIPTSTGGGGGGGYTPPPPPPAPVSATATSISINSGAATATSRTVTLTLLASNASQMKICNTADFVGCAFETYSTTKQWTLTEGDGVKTVYAKFASSTGGESSTISDAITLALPVVPVPPVVEPVEPKKEEAKVQTREQIIASLQLQIADLIKKLQELQAKKAVQDGLPLAPSGVVFAKNLQYGMRNNADVTKLQELLTRESVYSGPITGNFFALTRSAVVKFQEKYADEILKPFELTTGNGFVGAKTREKLNALMK